ncbi:phosphopentomutase [Aequitasia blattaphilus]|uniref:Phosphopentomutase n=1 Tax=Aequitasia blattaphilus TaxID=2949332 RepID=A0ABT1E7P5_9FIRM|nr:phosphopentomutase [Aequitasia blattaphilus]MCP1101808.1 phosphopentomutase [Aequitasia blattaphilus]MCR8614448.1 phosphopentomutase [Aequitasia blattaphilus]
MKTKRIFLIVLDSFGIGNAPDAKEFGDEGSNTLESISTSKEFHVPSMDALGLLKIDGVQVKGKAENIKGSYGRMTEASRGKDTTIGHWEIGGIVSKKPLPVYPNGFPKDIMDEFERRTGRKAICNLPYSGTEVLKDYGKEQMETGALIVYTSADSVFQIAAHEEVVPLEELYKDCEIAREILKGEHGVGRVIARPFVGKDGAFVRTSNRHDFSLLPPKLTMLDVLMENGLETKGVGKISDIFAKKGISSSVSIKDNRDGMMKTLEIQKEDFTGLCFINLVDFDMKYGHRNDVDGYAKAITEFDTWLDKFLHNMNPDDVLMITADHGCDPGFPGTDHTRECVPLLITGEEIKKGISLGTRDTFADIGASVLDLFELEGDIDGESFIPLVS